MGCVSNVSVEATGISRRPVCTKIILCTEKVKFLHARLTKD